jgi:ATP-dependent DNA helicase PIF1
VVAPTGVVAFNVDGYTIHSLLSLPTSGEFKDLEGEHLNKLQQSVKGMKYLIIDEMSMLGRKMLGQVDRRLRQVFPHRSDEVLGGCSCLLVGDFGQLPSVLDLPLYATIPSSSLSDIGSNVYHTYDHAIVLEQIIMQAIRQ